MRRFRMVLAVVMAALGGLSLFFATGVLAQQVSSNTILSLTHQIQQQSKPKAYVLIGDAGGQTAYAYLAALEAESDYVAAGYEVIFINGANKQDVINAFNNPDTQALWILGHGKYDEVIGENGKEKLTVPAPMIDMNDTYIQPSDFTQNFNIKQVTLHSCGQDLPSWRALFPNCPYGNFASWKSTLRPYQYLWWQAFNKYDPVTYTPSAPVPVIDSVLEQTGQFYFEPTVGKYVADMSYIANDFTLYDSLKSQLGSQSLNFYAVDTDTGDRQILFGADIADGKIVSSSASGTGTPTFDVSVTNEGLSQILEHPSRVWNAYSIGSLQITPYVPVDEDILFEGIAGLVFGQSGGVGGIAEPPDVEALPADTTNQASIDHTGLARVFGGVVAGILIVVASGTVWYARRRRLS